MPESPGEAEDRASALMRALHLSEVDAAGVTGKPARGGVVKVVAMIPPRHAVMARDIAERHGFRATMVDSLADSEGRLQHEFESDVRGAGPVPSDFDFSQGLRI